MSLFKENLSKLLAIVPIIIMLTIVNVFIAVTVSITLLLQLLSNGYDKYTSLIIGIMVGVAVHVYIMYNHKFRDYIKKNTSGANNNE